MLSSDHNGSLLRQQHGAHMLHHSTQLRKLELQQILFRLCSAEAVEQAQMACHKAGIPALKLAP